MTVRIALLDTVALTVDLPELGLSVGEVGAVVEVLDDGAAFEVEFCDNSGTTYSLHALTRNQLIILHTRGQALRFRDVTVGGRRSGPPNIEEANDVRANRLCAPAETTDRLGPSVR